MNARIVNKSIKPNHLVKETADLEQKILSSEKKLPTYLRDYWIFLHSSVSLRTKYSYILDIILFFEYLCDETLLTLALEPAKVSLNEITHIKARDVNEFLGGYCRKYQKKIGDQIFLYENSIHTLSRKKSSLSSMFRFLYRNEQIPQDITLGFNPIKLPPPQPDGIKRLVEDEVMELLDIVSTGRGLTAKELVFWDKTKLRDRAIVLLFVTYGLRLGELVNIDLNSINFSHREFTIYRKRNKVSIMPLNQSTESALKSYIDLERDRLIDHDALFLSLQGTRLSQRAVRNMIKKYTSIVLKVSRCQGYSPHKLRATAASTLIERGFSIYDVQNLLDHDYVTTTQLYASHRKNLKEEIIRRFELDHPEKV